MDETTTAPLAPQKWTALPCGGYVFTDDTGKPVLLAHHQTDAANAALEENLIELGWDIRVGHWLANTSEVLYASNVLVMAGAELPPRVQEQDGPMRIAVVLTAERLGPKADDAQIDATLKVASRVHRIAAGIEWVPANDTQERWDRAKVGNVTLLLGSRVVGPGARRYSLTLRRESWDPARSVEMTVSSNDRPSQGRIELLVQAIEAAHEVLCEAVSED